jgi:GntR family transcriptional regulator
MRRLDESTTSTLLEFVRVPTPEFLRREAPEFGENVLLVRRLRTVNDVPVILATSYVPERLAPLLNKVRLRKTTILVTLDKLGHSAATADQQTTAVAAEPYVARHLKCPVGAPLLNVRMLTRDQHGRALDFTNVVYRPDSYELRTRIERPARARTTRPRRSP